MKENDQSALTKGQRTTHRILDAAEVQFAAHGYGAASLRDIAAAADIQQPGLYKHFSSKEELYQRVCERALSPLVDFMDELLERPVDQMIYR
ncbi:helix-turn-helix domain-containing protein, partial [Peribacillus frigoritolerans]|uniref:TetR/AcrR family transcriptional regulator n=1 Tax=Peribacillus frigoritolerans TaxID=450367 RepID=UPI002B2515E9